MSAPSGDRLTVAQYQALPTGQRFSYGARHPVWWLDDLTGDGPLYALVVLFLLNAVDELDREAFAVLLPEIRDHFNLDNQGVLTLIAAVLGVALLLQTPIAHLADRRNRVRLMWVGALVWSVFSFGTGVANVMWFLVVTRWGSGLGKAVIDPTHNSLIADWWRPELRPRIFSFHRAANSVGIILGAGIGGVIGGAFGWRVPFLVLPVFTIVVVVMALRLVEPKRGGQELAAMGIAGAALDVEETPPSFAEAYRLVWSIGVLRRLFMAMPFLAVGVAGFGGIAAVFYEQQFDLSEAERGWLRVAVEPWALVGFAIGSRVAMKLLAKGPDHVLRLIATVTVVASAGAAGLAVAPNVPLGYLAQAVIAASLAIVVPGVFVALSMAIPARARSVGFSIASLYVLPGLVMLPLVGMITDNVGPRWGMLAMCPIFLVGGLIIASAHTVITQDITNVWTSSAARAEMLAARRAGQAKLLNVRNLDVKYGDVQILFGVDFEVDEGEIVALLGTNGAGKSTLLKAICGVVEASNGAVIFDGRDITYAPPYEIAGFGIVQVPGGQGVFPSLSVEENLRIAGWLQRKDPEGLREATAHVLETFPVLRQRLGDPAANLSGGQQQMLALGMAFLTKPKLLCIDELSLGLAPIIVEQLLPIVREMRDNGTTVIIVEQSVNVALTVAETAYFMEKGEIRFRGPTAELLERPDVLRSVFLEGAAKGMAVAEHDGIAEELGESHDGAAVGDGAVAHAVEAAASHASGRVSTVDLSAPPPLVVEGLTVHFGGIRAVDDVSFALHQGEILGIIGPNGAGKTTLYDLISGFTPADAGRVSLGDHDLTPLPPHDRAWLGLGRSFQDARLFPSLTVEETIKVSLDRWVEVKDPILAALRLPAVYDSEEDVTNRADELIDLLGLDAFRSKFVRELSTGSRRIVDLACLLAHRPAVVLLDEPSSGIAQRETEALGPLMLRIRDQLGASLLVIEHDMPLITSVSDRLMALESGHVVTIGEPNEVLAHPDVVESYLGRTKAVIERSGAGA